jgi:hypothetical protein
VQSALGECNFQSDFNIFAFGFEAGLDSENRLAVRKLRFHNFATLGRKSWTGGCEISGVGS